MPGPAEWLLLLLIAILLLYVWAWNAPVQEFFLRLACRTRLCMFVLFALPILLRLLLLPRHPVPTPDIYDEFSHLLVADTLLQGRLANPPHPLQQFFETFFVLQQPTYSSIYPLGLGLEFAFGRLVSGIAWTGVLTMSGLLCAGCYWMLKGWGTPGWALLGGLLAVAEFGPLCLWTNSYWGGSLAAVAGCLVFGALPRLQREFRTRDALLLGFGLGAHMLVRQFESVLLVLAITLFFIPFRNWRLIRQILPFAVAGSAPAVLLLLLQNHSVTHSWTTLPEQLSQYQQGVPTSLTFQPVPIPHLPLTREQALDYKAQALMHGSAPDSLSKFLLRLEYRVRYYRFFFLPPLYLALIAFLSAYREPRYSWIVATLLLFALGTNLFPYLLVHYLAALTSLFLRVAVIGLQRIERLLPAGHDVARVLVLLCLAEFSFWYSLHLFERPGFYPVLRYETWDSINHGDDPHGRKLIASELAAMRGPLLVFVHYSSHHIYQNEWVWNSADIDRSRIVFARDLGPQENEKLIRYYPARKLLSLNPDGNGPSLRPY